MKLLGDANWYPPDGVARQAASSPGAASPTYPACTFLSLSWQHFHRLASAWLRQRRCRLSSTASPGAPHADDQHPYAQQGASTRRIRLVERLGHRDMQRGGLRVRRNLLSQTRNAERVR